jgi:hypothetical protein
MFTANGFCIVDGAPIHSLVPGVIATDELEGLHAVLRLLRQIVKQVCQHI